MSLAPQSRLILPQCKECDTERPPQEYMFDPVDIRDDPGKRANSLIIFAIISASMEVMKKGFRNARTLWYYWELRSLNLLLSGSRKVLFQAYSHGDEKSQCLQRFESFAVTDVGAKLIG